MKTYSFGNGKVKAQHETDCQGGHKLHIEVVGVGKTASPWTSTTLPITWENQDGTVHLVAQCLTGRLPIVFQMLCEDEHELEIMTS